MSFTRAQKNTSFFHWDWRGSKRIEGGQRKSPVFSSCKEVWAGVHQRKQNGWQWERFAVRSTLEGRGRAFNYGPQLWVHRDSCPTLFIGTCKRLPHRLVQTTVGTAPSQQEQPHHNRDSSIAAESPIQWRQPHNSGDSPIMVERAPSQQGHLNHSGDSSITVGTSHHSRESSILVGTFPSQWGQPYHSRDSPITAETAPSLWGQPHHSGGQSHQGRGRWIVRLAERDSLSFLIRLLFSLAPWHQRQDPSALNAGGQQ